MLYLRFPTCLFLFSLSTLLSAKEPRFTDSEQQFIKKHNQIVLGGDPDWEPMIIKQSNGTITGFERELLDEIEKSSGLEIELITGVWNDIVHKARNKEIDGLVYSSPQPERKQFFNWSKTYNRFKVGFYSTLNQDVLQDINDLEGATIGVQENDQFSNNYIDSLRNVQLKVFSTRSEMIEGLLTEEVDYIFGALDINYYLWKNSISGVHLVLLPKDKGFDAVYSIRNDWPELVSILNKSLDAIGQETILGIMNKWLEPESSNGLPTEDQIFLNQFDHLNLVTTEKWMPIVDVKPTGELNGWLGDYMRLIENTMGFPFEPMATGDSSVIDSMARLDNTVFVYPDFFQKRPQFHYSEPILEIPYGLGMIKGVFFDDINNLGSIKVAVLKYNPHIQRIKQAYPNIEIQITSSTKESLDRILSGDLDGYIGSISTLNHHIHSLGYSEVFIAGLLDIKTTLHFSSSNQELIDVMNRTMKLVPNGKKQEIIRNWYGGSTIVEDRSLAIKITLIFIVVISIVSIWAFSLWFQIKKRKSLHEKLLTNQANVYALIENSDALIYSIDPNLRIIVTNNAFVNFLKHYSDIPVENGTSLAKVIPEKFRDAWILRYTRALNGEKYSVQDNMEFFGISRTFITHLNPIKINGEVLGVSCLTEDVTHLTRLNQYMISLMNSSYDYIFIKNLEGRYVMASQTLAEINGFDSWKEFVDKSDKELGLNDSEMFQAEDQRVLRDHVHIINKEQNHLDQYGNERWMQTTKEPIFNEAGEVIGLSGISRDITEKRKGEQEQKMLISTIENSQDLIFFLDHEFQFIYMNAAGKALLGFEEIQGVSVSEIIHPVTYKVLINALKNIVLKGEPWHEEFEVISKSDSRKITMDNHIMSIFDDDGDFICYVSVSRDVTERNILQEQIIDAKLNQELVNASLKAADNERVRIAHDLHDGIQQQIATVSIYLQSIDWDSNPQGVIQDSLSKLNETIADIRRMSNRMLPRALMSVGLQGVIYDEVQTINKKSALKLSFHENLGEHRIDAEVELNLYRIFQEGISNILKYSKANEVQIQLLLSGNVLTMVIEDDGVGFDRIQKTDAGIGLSSMSHRAESIGAHLEVDTVPGEGTSILVEVKL